MTCFPTVIFGRHFENSLTQPFIEAFGYLKEIFPIVKRKDEAKLRDDRTKHQILKIYDFIMTDLPNHQVLQPMTAVTSFPKAGGSIKLANIPI